MKIILKSIIIEENIDGKNLDLYVITDFYEKIPLFIGSSENTILGTVETLLNNK